MKFFQILYESVREFVTSGSKKSPNGDFFVFMHYVYILFSTATNKYYIGETPDVIVRLEFHNDAQKNTNSTKTGIPWELFWSLEVADRSIARKIESHIKQMRTQKYYNDLKKYSEISKKLTKKYSVTK